MRWGRVKTYSATGEVTEVLSSSEAGEGEGDEGGSELHFGGCFLVMVMVMVMVLVRRSDWTLMFKEVKRRMGKTMNKNRE